MASERLAFHARRIPFLRAPLAGIFASNLRELNDAVRDTDLNGHYWVWGGLLLGWARQGAILAHDTMDADFALLDEDFWRLAEAVPAITKAGFECDRRFLNNNADLTEVTFIRHGARFEFFRMFPAESRLTYFMYGDDNGKPVELQASLPEQPTVPFDFIGRTWLKHKDHELELRSMYGSWEIPDPAWSYLDGPDIEVRRPWLHTDWNWEGGQAALLGERPA